MVKWLKRVVVFAAVVFILFFVVTRPTETVHVLQIFWQGIVDIFWSVYHFFAPS